MSPKNLTTLCGQFGLIVAFVLIAGIVAAPLLQRVWSTDTIVAHR